MVSRMVSRRSWVFAIVMLVVGLITGFGATQAAQRGDANWQHARIVSWSGSSDAEELTVVVLQGYGVDMGVRVKVVEQSATVIRLQGWTIPRPGVHDLIGQAVTIRVMLDAPLGDRKVLNADGSTVVRVPS